MYPERFHNVTNGITYRRWLIEANPGLRPSSPIPSATVGQGPGSLEELEKFVDDEAFCAAFEATKQENKKRLAAI